MDVLPLVRQEVLPKGNCYDTCGEPVHYPCLELHISRCRDCRRIVDKDELALTTDRERPCLRTAREQARLAGDRERSQELILSIQA